MKRPNSHGERTVQRWMNVKQAAEYLSISEKGLRYRIEIRQIPFHRLGGSIRFDKFELDQMLEEHGVEAMKMRR